MQHRGDDDQGRQSGEGDRPSILDEMVDEGLSIAAQAERPCPGDEGAEEKKPTEVESCPELRRGAEEEHERALPGRHSLRPEQAKQTIQRQDREKLRKQLL